MADLLILDISKFQPTVDYEKVAKEVDGVILRIGVTYWGAQNMSKDPYFDKHYTKFKKLGVPVGAYYYSAADTVAVAQKEADYCLSLLKNHQFELPIYYDVENNERQGRLSKAQLTQIVEAFCSKVESAGYFVGFYSYTSWLLTKFDTAYLSKKYTLWKADYRVHPNTSIVCDMHQYTSSGIIDGISTPVDLSHCYRDFTTPIKKNGLNGFKKSSTNTTISKPVPDTLRVGDSVKVLKAVQYDNGKSFKTWFSSYTVKQISGNRVVIAKAGVTVAAVHRDNLKKL